MQSKIIVNSLLILDPKKESTLDAGNTEQVKVTIGYCVSFGIWT